MNNLDLFERSKKIIPGGVNSPVRAFKAVGGTPKIMERASGAYLFDVDGNKYIDFIGSWGPMILGHNNPVVMSAVKLALENGVSFGTSNPLETDLAELICELVPSVEMVRMVNSGTEATMSAVRLARGFTGRSKIVKCEGCYHGHYDGFLVKAGSGVTSMSSATSAGLTPAITQETIVVPYNNSAALDAVLTAHKDEIAAFIIEPVPGNMGFVWPSTGYLEAVRDLTKAHGTLLIFDEVMTGFRQSLGGVQEIIGVKPDLTTFGKVIGGGFPVGAFGGRRDIMEKLAPLGDVYQAGTLSGNPIAMASGLATLKELQNGDKLSQLNTLCDWFFSELRTITENSKIPTQVASHGSMGCLYFNEEPVFNFEDALKSDTTRFGDFFRYLLGRGVYLPPAQFESWFISTSHSKADLQETLNIIADYFQLHLA
jgi:glutamate-1-semialdehyde 2,1-aminomutase